MLPLAATLAQWRSWRLLGRWLQFSGLLLHGHAHGAGLLAATHARSPRLRRPAVAETVGWPTGRRMMQSGRACEVRSSLAVRALLRAVITVAIGKARGCLGLCGRGGRGGLAAAARRLHRVGCSGGLILQGVDALLRGAGLPRTEAQPVRALLVFLLFLPTLLMSQYVTPRVSDSPLHLATAPCTLLQSPLHLATAPYTLLLPLTPLAPRRGWPRAPRADLRLISSRSPPDRPLLSP